MRRESNGERTPLFVGAADDIGEGLYNDHGDALMRAIKAGANEVHVHLATESDELCARILEDIARGWCVPVRASARPLVHA